MKKFIYLSIVLASLSLSSFRSQDNVVKSTHLQTSKEINNKSTDYANFDSTAITEIRAAKPPQD